MNDKQLPLYVLTAVAIVGFIAAIGMFAALAAGLFDTYDFATGDVSGPSPMLALIPLAVGVLAGIGALMLWGMQRQRD